MQASKTIWYVRGKRVKQWCKEYMDFPTGKKNMSIFIRGLIKVEALHPAVLQDKERKILAPLPLSRFDPDTVQYADDAWYIWGYEGDMTTRNIQLALLIGTLFLMCLAPVWPRSVKIGVWWLSVTLLIIMIGFSIVRMLIWLVVWIVSGYNLTIFPYIFIDGIPISEAFQPWGGETEYSGGAWYPDQDPSMRYYRIGTLAAVVAMGAWIALQPTKFDDYVATTREFTADLYEGNLLSDMSQQARDNIDKPRYQSLAEILMEEAAEAAAANEQAKEDSESADTTGNDLIDEILEDEAAEDAELEAERATAESSDL